MLRATLSNALVETVVAVGGLSFTVECPLERSRHVLTRVFFGSVRWGDHATLTATA